MIISKEFHFSAAHYLKNYKGKCERMHGHTYKLEISIEGDVDKESGMVIDFNDIKSIVEDKIINLFDHSLINDIIEQPTAENIAIYIWNELEGNFKTERYHLYKVSVWEGPTSRVDYYGK